MSNLFSTLANPVAASPPQSPPSPATLNTNNNNSNINSHHHHQLDSIFFGGNQTIVASSSSTNNSGPVSPTTNAMMNLSQNNNNLVRQSSNNNNNNRSGPASNTNSPGRSNLHHNSGRRNSGTGLPPTGMNAVIAQMEFPPTSNLMSAGMPNIISNNNINNSKRGALQDDRNDISQVEENDALFKLEQEHRAQRINVQLSVQQQQQQSQQQSNNNNIMQRTSSSPLSGTPTERGDTMTFPNNTNNSSNSNHVIAQPSQQNAMSSSMFARTSSTSTSTSTATTSSSNSNSNSATNSANAVSPRPGAIDILPKPTHSSPEALEEAVRSDARIGRPYDVALEYNRSMLARYAIITAVLAAPLLYLTPILGLLMAPTGALVGYWSYQKIRFQHGGDVRACVNRDCSIIVGIVFISIALVIDTFNVLDLVFGDSSDGASGSKLPGSASAPSYVTRAPYSRSSGAGGGGSGGNFNLLALVGTTPTDPTTTSAPPTTVTLGKFVDVNDAGNTQPPSVEYTHVHEGLSHSSTLRKLEIVFGSLVFLPAIQTLRYLWRVRKLVLNPTGPNSNYNTSGEHDESENNNHDIVIVDRNHHLESGSM